MYTIKSYQKKSPYILLFSLTLIQCVFLTVNEYQNIRIIDVITYIISTFTFYLLLSSISKKLLSFFIVISFVITCFIFPTQLIYGVVDRTYINSIYYTNTYEILSYIKIIPHYCYLLLAALGCFHFYLIKTKKTVIKYPLKIKIILLIVLSILPIRMFFIKGFSNDLHTYIYVLPIRKLAVFDIYRNH